MDIDKIIKDNIDKIDEDFIKSNLIDFFIESEIKYIRKEARNCYGDNDVGLQSFIESLKNEIFTSCKSFILTNEFWKTRSIIPFIKKVISRHSQNISKRGVAHKVYLICPACRFYGKKGDDSFLKSKNGTCYCEKCKEEISKIEDEIKLNNNFKLNINKKLRSVFVEHSRKGYQCPDCKSFIPASSKHEDNLVCPYPNCFFVGKENDLKIMNHPLISLKVSNISLDQDVSKDGFRKITLENFISSQETEGFILDEIIDDKINLLNEIIDAQISFIKRTEDKSTTLIKIMMFDAFKKILEKDPQDMISYLFFGKKQIGNPIQARIFQEFSRNIESMLPFEITKAGKKIQINDLLDENISLFDGLSEFSAEVKENGIIPNKTKEIYIGGNNFKNYGPCFIGYLKDVIDEETGNSLMNLVTDYSFSKIKSKIASGKKVKVIHYRIPSHYEMGTLVTLQKTRKKITENINKKEKNI
jgi:hypothetical protein